MWPDPRTQYWRPVIAGSVSGWRNLARGRADGAGVGAGGDDAGMVGHDAYPFSAALMFFANCRSSTSSSFTATWTSSSPWIASSTSRSWFES